MPDSAEAKTRILEAAVQRAREGPVEGITIASIAKSADCAKGLVHYHFGTKDALLAAAAAAVWDRRREAWHDVMRRGTATDAVDRGWKTVSLEASEGRARAAVTLAARSDSIGRSAREAAANFRLAVTADLVHVLQRMDRTLTVPPEEAGQLFVAAINGLAMELEMGADPGVSEAAWAAFWVGLLSLTG